MRIHPNYVIWCVAGSSRESEWWREELGYSSDEWRCLDNPSRLYGTRFPQFVRVGNWAQHWRSGDLGMLLMRCQALEVSVDQLRDERRGPLDYGVWQFNEQYEAAPYTTYEFGEMTKAQILGRFKAITGD